MSTEKITRDFRVHLYATVTVSVNVKATDMISAIHHAIDTTDLANAVKTAPYADEVSAALVDVVGNHDFSETTLFQHVMPNSDFVDSKDLTVPNSLAQLAHADIAVIQKVVEMATAHLDDIESGMEDGTYAKDDNSDYDFKKQSLELFVAALGRNP